MRKDEISETKKKSSNVHKRVTRHYASERTLLFLVVCEECHSGNCINSVTAIVTSKVLMSNVILSLWSQLSSREHANRALSGGQRSWMARLSFLLCTWWRHQMEIFSAILAICARNSPVFGEFPAQRPVTRIFDVFFDLRLNNRLNKQSWG